MNNMFHDLGNMFGPKGNYGCDDHGCGGHKQVDACTIIWILIILYIIFCTDILKCINPCWLILLLLLITSCNGCDNDRDKKHDNCGC